MRFPALAFALAAAGTAMATPTPRQAQDARSAQALAPSPISRQWRTDGDGGLRARQEAPKVCSTIFCNSDEHCLGQKAYGYDCSRCFFVSDGVGNCMP